MATWVGIIVIFVALGLLVAASLMRRGAGPRPRGDRSHGGPIVGWGNDTHLPGS